jgi:hypothetical protein
LSQANKSNQQKPSGSQSSSRVPTLASGQARLLHADNQPSKHSVAWHQLPQPTTIAQTSMLLWQSTARCSEQKAGAGRCCVWQSMRLNGAIGNRCPLCTSGALSVDAIVCVSEVKFNQSVWNFSNSPRIASDTAT